jgi:mono/diheme cytochrome c family protein
MKRSLVIGILLLAFMAGAAFNAAEEEKKEQPLDEKVMEIFSRSCATSGCHAGKSPKAGLSLEAEKVPGNLVGVKSMQNTKRMLIDAEDPAGSYLLLKITGGEGMKGKKMPIFKKALTEDEIKAVTLWVMEFGEKKKAEEMKKKEMKNEEKKEEKDD